MDVVWPTIGLEGWDGNSYCLAWSDVIGIKLISAKRRRTESLLVVVIIGITWVLVNRLTICEVLVANILCSLPRCEIILAWWSSHRPKLSDSHVHIVLNERLSRLMISTWPTPQHGIGELVVMVVISSIRTYILWQRMLVPSPRSFYCHSYHLVFNVWGILNN